MVTGPGPHYAPLLEMDPAQVRAVLSDHVALLSQSRATPSAR